MNCFRPSCGTRASPTCTSCRAVYSTTARNPAPTIGAANFSSSTTGWLCRSTARPQSRTRWSVSVNTAAPRQTPATIVPTRPATLCSSPVPRVRKSILPAVPTLASRRVTIISNSGIRNRSICGRQSVGGSTIETSSNILPILKPSHCVFQVRMLGSSLLKPEAITPLKSGIQSLRENLSPRSPNDLFGLPRPQPSTPQQQQQQEKQAQPMEIRQYLINANLFKSRVKKRLDWIDLVIYLIGIVRIRLFPFWLGITYRTNRQGLFYNFQSKLRRSLEEICFEVAKQASINCLLKWDA